MRRALALAEKGRDTVAPNPMVGAVVVRDGEVVGEGYHREAGQAHAEVLALRVAGDRARGATLYVNLEPCCHVEKRTPPCTEAIVRAGVARVVVSMRDPNPRVFGRGLERLAEQHVEVSEGLFSSRAFEQNRGFSSLIRQGRPYVTLKGAMSLDGKIATATGDSQWISGQSSLAYAHRLRRDHDAILVGISTATKDDPRLTNRLPGSRNHQPVRVILDSTGRLPPDSRLFSEEGGGACLSCGGTPGPGRGPSPAGEERGTDLRSGRGTSGGDRPRGSSFGPGRRGPPDGFGGRRIEGQRLLPRGGAGGPDPGGSGPPPDRGSRCHRVAGGILASDPVPGPETSGLFGPPKAGGRPSRRGGSLGARLSSRDRGALTGKMTTGGQPPPHERSGIGCFPELLKPQARYWHRSASREAVWESAGCPLPGSLRPENPWPSTGPA